SPYVFDGSAPNEIVWLAFPIVRLFVPLLPAKLPSPPKLAPTPLVYVPAPMPARLTFDNVATPDAFVEAPPAGVPFSVNPTDFPLTPVLPAVSVADNVVVPP